MLAPHEYLAKLTDYSEEGKHLNYLMSYYLPYCGINLITKIGFGKGTLKRMNHSDYSRREKPGAPYQMKVGQNRTPQIPYENPDEFFTFRWFKVNIICLEQPWICGFEGNRSETYSQDGNVVEIATDIKIEVV